MQNLSATGSPAISRADALSSGEEVGGQYVDLRGLGPERTLVLLDGKRMGVSTGGYTDLASIPTSVVERIEVLTDGASAIYGSDAIAGVINIITRKNFDGLEASVYGASTARAMASRSTTSSTARPVSVVRSPSAPSTARKIRSGRRIVPSAATRTASSTEPDRRRRQRLVAGIQPRRADRQQ